MCVFVYVYGVYVCVCLWMHVHLRTRACWSVCVCLFIWNDVPANAVGQGINSHADQLCFLRASQPASRHNVSELHDPTRSLCAYIYITTTAVHERDV